jgi:polyisoprenyl-teichoic acid--peptidoglycan teichoic acid transferase
VTVGSPERAARPRSPSIAALLSFLWPGLGQWYAGRRWAALLFAVPVGAAAGLLASQLRGGLFTFVGSLLDPTFGVAMLAGIAILGLWRVLAMIHAARVASRTGWRRRGLGIVLPVLLLLAVGAHGAAGYYVWSFSTFGKAIYDPNGVGFEPQPSDPLAPPSDRPGASPSPDASDPIATPRPTRPGTTPEPTPDPLPSGPPVGDDRITVLLLGIDRLAGEEGRDHSLTDTILVASVDSRDGTASMVSFPRDISDFPLSNGNRYTNRINSLMSYAYRHIDRFPGHRNGLEVLRREIGFLLGVPIDYYAAIDLAGFVTMVDLVGGVDVENPRDIVDPQYPAEGGQAGGFTLPAGRHHLDGRTALKYVRTRKGQGDDDCSRASRQQQVLVALRQKVTSPQVLPRVPAILQEAGRIIRTDLPPERIGPLLRLASETDPGSIRRVVLGAPYAYHPPIEETDGRWIMRLDMKRVRMLSLRLYREDSRYHRPGQELPPPLPAPTENTARNCGV